MQFDASSPSWLEEASSVSCGSACEVQAKKGNNDNDISNFHFLFHYPYITLLYYSSFHVSFHGSSMFQHPPLSSRLLETARASPSRETSPHTPVTHWHSLAQQAEHLDACEPQLKNQNNYLMQPFHARRTKPSVSAPNIQEPDIKCLK